MKGEKLRIALLIDEGVDPGRNWVKQLECVARIEFGIVLVVNRMIEVVCMGSTIDRPMEEDKKLEMLGNW